MRASIKTKNMQLPEEQVCPVVRACLILPNYSIYINHLQAVGMLCMSERYLDRHGWTLKCSHRAKDT